jgi:hypothetical protein
VFIINQYKIISLHVNGIFALIQFTVIVSIHKLKNSQYYLTSVDYLKNMTNIQNRRWIRSYKSVVLAFDSLWSQSVSLLLVISSGIGVDRMMHIVDG